MRRVGRVEEGQSQDGREETNLKGLPGTKKREERRGSVSRSSSCVFVGRGVGKGSESFVDLQMIAEKACIPGRGKTGARGEEREGRRVRRPELSPKGVDQTMEEER